MEKFITHKYFKYFKYVGLSIILFECIKTGTALFGYVGFVGTEQEWRFTLVLISFTLKLSLFVSISLASILHHIYENGKLKNSILNEV
jgi:hypothetical protein